MRRSVQWKTNPFFFLRERRKKDGWTLISCQICHFPSSHHSNTKCLSSIHFPPLKDRLQIITNSIYLLVFFEKESIVKNDLKDTESHWKNIEKERLLHISRERISSNNVLIEVENLKKGSGNSSRDRIKHLIIIRLTFRDHSIVTKD